MSFWFQKCGVLRTRAMHKDVYKDFQPLRFRTRAYSSVYFFQRLALYEKLEEHNGESGSQSFSSFA